MNNEMSGNADNVVQAQHIGSITFNAAPAAAPHLHSVNPPTLDVPVRGREAELFGLLGMLEQPRGQFAVISGPGGSGKSTLAAELAARAMRADVTVWWIRWHDKESFARQLMEIVETLGLPDRPAMGLPDLVWTALAGHTRWLLVIDNVDRPELLCPTGEPLSEYRGWVRPDGPGLLVVTSRDGDRHQWGRAAELIRLAPLATQDAATVLLDAAPDAGTAGHARELAARLGGFPLALRAAGRAIAQPTARHHTFDAYRAALDAEPADALAVLRTTWELSLNQLAEEGHQLAGPLLGVLSLAADAPLPRAAVTPALLHPIAPDATPAAVDAALAGLYRYGLVQAATRPVPTVSLHPVVREINATRLAEVQPGQEALDRQLLACGREAAEAKRAGWDLALLLAPHLVAIPARYGSMSELVLAAGPIFDGLFLAVLRARYTLGRELRDGIPGIPDRIADAVRRVGEFERAVALLGPLRPPRPGEVVWEDRRTPKNPHYSQYYAMSMMFEMIVEAREIMLGLDHPDTVRGQKNLAIARAGAE